MKLTLMLLCLTVSSFADDAVQLQGLLSFEFNSPMGKSIPKLSSTNYFTLLIDRLGRYSCELKCGDTGDIICSSFDGEDTFCVMYTETVADRQGKPVSKKPIQSMVQNAFVCSSNYPFYPVDGFRRSQILWLAYGSASTFVDDHPREMPLPWTEALFSLAGYGFEVQPSVGGDAPRLLKSCKFIRATKYDLTTEDAELNRPELERVTDLNELKRWKTELIHRRKDFQQGFVAGDFETLSFTNLGGISVPLTFELRTFNPDWRSGPKLRYVSSVTNVELTLSPVKFRPEIRAPLRVSDTRYRYRDKTKAFDALVYFVKINGEWPDKGSALLKNQLAGKMSTPAASNRIVPSTIRLHRFIAIGLVLMAAVFVPLLLYRRIRMRPGR